MRVKIAEKASSKWQKMQTTLSRNCCSKNAPKLSAVIHCLQWITAKIALKMQWDFGHSGNLQNLQGNCLQCVLGWTKSPRIAPSSPPRKSMNFGDFPSLNPQILGCPRP